MFCCTMAHFGGQKILVAAGYHKSKQHAKACCLFLCYLIFTSLPRPRVSKLAGDIAQLSASGGRCSETEQLKHRELKAGAPAPTRNDLLRRAGTDS